MAEVEKGLVKESYSRIGKEEIKGVVVEETPTNKEEKEAQNNAKWMERKTSLIYDYEEDSINFSRSKPTEWNDNKRIHLPKSGSASLEAYCEVRRGEASRLYDECLALLGDGDKKGFENISNMEKQGIKSLQKRIKNHQVKNQVKNYQVIERMILIY